MKQRNKQRVARLGSWRLLTWCWVLISTPSLAQQTDGSAAVFSIQDCINYATQHNSNIKVAQYDEEIAHQRIREIKGRGLPQVNVSGNFEDRLKIPLLVLPEGSLPGSTGGRSIQMGYKYNSLLSAEATQMIFDPSFWVGLKAAQYSTQLYQQTSQRVNEQTAYSIASNYYQAIVVQKQLQLLHTNLASTRKTLTTTELQFKNGVAKQVDVNRLRVNTRNLESLVRQAELNLTQALNGLKFQLGMPLSQPLALGDTVLTFREEESVLKGEAGNYVENRLDYQILQTNLALQELDRKNNSSGYFPTLTAYANYGYNSQGARFGFFKTSENGWVDYTTSAIGLRLRIPVFDGLQRDARVQQAKLKTKQLEENVTLTRQNIDLEVANALTQYRNTLQRINTEQESVQLAEEVYRVTQLEFREGVGTSTDIVNAETSLRQAQNNYITTLLDLYKARLDLERAKGNLLPYLSSAR